MTDEERKLLVEISAGLGVLFDRLSSGYCQNEIRRDYETYLGRVADLTVKVHRSVAPQPAADLWKMQEIRGSDEAGPNLDRPQPSEGL